MTETGFWRHNAVDQYLHHRAPREKVTLTCTVAFVAKPICLALIHPSDPTLLL